MMISLIDALFLILLSVALVVLIVRDYAQTSWPVRAGLLGIVYLCLDLAFHRLAGLDSPHYTDIAILRTGLDGLFATLALMRAWWARPVGKPNSQKSGSDYWVPFA